MLQGTLGRLPFAEPSTAAGTKGSFLSQKGFLGAQRQAASQRQSFSQSRLAVAAPSIAEVDAGARQLATRRPQAAEQLQVVHAFPEGSGSLPPALYRLLDPASPVELPAVGSVSLDASDNRELDKLIAALGRNKSTWRRALALHDWLLQSGHRPDDRLCTTLIRVCAQHGQAGTALSLYDWMRAPVAEGGAALTPTVFTYTAAMRAALTGSMMERAVQVWEDAVAAKCEIDCRLCTTLVEVCGRKGDTDRALEAYAQMRDAPRDSRMAPSVHAYTAAMRAASEGGRWEAALSIWEDMQKAGCKPTGHAYAAVISACAAGGQWQRAVSLFDEMLAWGVRPDVVSCTALITALGTDGQWERAEKVVEWMLRSDIRPNVRTFSALLTALGNAKQWERALDIVKRMRRHAYGGGLEPNAYTYSALLKTMGEQGKWQLAEKFFRELEAEQLDLMAREAAAADGRSRQLSSAGAGATSAAAASSTAAALAEAAGPDAAAAAAAALPMPSVPQQASISAFPGMAKELPTDAPGANPEAIAAAAAAVAALAAHQQQLAAAAGGAPAPLDFALLQQLAAQLTAAQVQHSAVAATAATAEEEGSLLRIASSAAEQVLATPRVGTRASDVPPAQQQHSEHSSAPFFSYFSGFASTAKPEGAAEPEAAFTGTSSVASSEQGDGDSPSGVADAAAAFACLAPFGLAPCNQFEQPQELWEQRTQQAAAAGPSSAAWTNDNAAVRGLSFHLDELSAGPSRPATASSSAAAASGGQPKLKPLPKGRGPVNEVVCGALMLAYERAGKWQEAVAVLERARSLGIAPNTIMFNTAISALGKARQADAAEALFRQMPAPDAVSYETLIAAYGMSGSADKAEAAFGAMKAAGFNPRDYAYCGLIAAHSFKGDWRAALRVQDRMRSAGVPPTVHVFNALIAACDRGHQYERAMAIARDMTRAGVPANAVTQQLLDCVCKEGVREVESQQAAAAALSAAVAAAGTIMIRAGVF